MVSSTSNSDSIKMKRRHALFFLCLTATLVFSGATAHRMLGLSWPAEKNGFRSGAFLSYYKGIGVDYNIFRYNLFRVAEPLKSAEIILYSSSKGIFGYRTDLLSEAISKASGRNISAFNTSLAFGEGIPFFVQIVKELDLHDKIAIVDLSAETYLWRYSAMAEKALSESRLDAYKTTLNVWMHYFFDYGANPFVPEAKLGSFAPRTSYMYSRSLSTGDDFGKPFIARFLVEAPPRFSAEFDPDGRLKSGFIEEFRRRNIGIIFTTIPYGGGPIKTGVANPEWARSVSNKLAIPYASVSWDGLYTVDGIHMDPKSAEIFSGRLAKALLDMPVNIVAGLGRIRAEPR